MVPEQEPPHWTRWVPLPDLPPLLCLNELMYGPDGTLTIALETQDATVAVLIHFEEAIAHMLSDEGDKLRCLASARGRYPWPLFKVENSYFSNFFERESCGKYRSQILIHFEISTFNEIIDVLALNEPSVTIALRSKDSNLLVDDLGSLTLETYGSEQKK